MNKIFLKILVDYIKKIKNIKSKVLAFSNDMLFQYFIKKTNIEKLGIRKITTFSKKIIKILKKNYSKISLQNIESLNKIDYFFCFSKYLNNNSFFKGYNGNICKEKSLYYFSKKRVVFSKKLYCNNKVPIEILPSLKYYIKSKLDLNFKCFLKKKKKNNIFYSVDNLNVIILNININYNFYLFERKISKIYGIVAVGIFFIIKNTEILTINKKKVRYEIY
ncbi:ribose-5-phosphate isomerase A [Candidatus Vidania fulgoroideorum]